MAKKITAPKAFKIKITRPVAGVFLLPYNVDQVIMHEAKQAQQMIDLGYAVKV